MAPAPSLVTDADVALFFEGRHARLHEFLGARPMAHDGVEGTYFAVWAPHARAVSVVGDWNDWTPGADPMAKREHGGIWEAFVPGVGRGARYKYHVQGAQPHYAIDKADPFARHAQEPPATASVVWDLGYEWGDGAWMAARAAKSATDAPMAIYELHLGSWRRAEAGHRWLGYRELSDPLCEYLTTMGFTHVELMPVMEHPYYASWGYQVTGYFAPTSRYGTPQDFMYLVDRLHACGIGVILDWVPSHFPSDGHGLSYFDGTHLYEHGDPRKGYHPDWESLIFDYSRHEVRSFLLSSARFWLETYHADALRVDAVASMLYLDYSRKQGEWIPNRYGGRENIDAIALLRAVNEESYTSCPGIQTVAEESTAWPLVSRPSYIGGLGFGYKWDMGWMHDTLEYFKLDPIHRRFHHGKITFRMIYAWSENFWLPLSHDEVVHSKGSLLNKMAGDGLDKFSTLRLLYGYMYGQPGKKLLFMGAELAQWREWSHDAELDWDLLEYPPHAHVQRFVRDLNRLYVSEKALHELDCDPSGFAWIDCNDSDQSVISFERKGKDPKDRVVVACNFTPIPRFAYAIGAPELGTWREVCNSDSRDYGGAGLGNFGKVEAEAVSTHGRPGTLRLTLPALSILFFRWDGPPPAAAPASPPSPTPAV